MNPKTFEQIEILDDLFTGGKHVPAFLSSSCDKNKQLNFHSYRDYFRWHESKYSKCQWKDHDSFFKCPYCSLQN
jgi:hypothetical protein